ncbi:MAG: NYN domain-containing protein [Pseudodesulfovibrio sp.]|uniref:NYN domain-containing protein n=1 Tax=Pseudodesulfovibrio sp. TaxID=2035812 RepID=UPI003D0ADCFA
MRYSFFIDGFNVYHWIDKGPLGDRFKWINYYDLAQKFTPKGHELAEVRYFTAYADHMPDKKRRHKALCRALVASGVKLRRGKFKMKDRICFKCGSRWKAHEEKQSDINLAIDLLEEAMRDSFDVAVVLSADTDFAPAVRTVRRLYPEKEVQLLLPSGMRADELKQVCSCHKLMYPNQLKSCRLPNAVQYNAPAGGRLVIHCPQEYL